MKRFMDEEFLLNSETASRLYHEYAENMPIIDYHCHLNPREIAENKKFRNITEAWLGGDHYKWRAMRANGVEEKYITGDAPDKEKFIKWAETLSCCIGNPVYQWTHLELKRYFGIDEVLSAKNAEKIWDKCNALLQTDEYSVRSLIKRFNVKVVCTTDDPADTLEYHTAIAADKSFDIKVLPAFRPDKGINLEKDGFAQWVGRLSAVSGIEIKTLKDLKDALKQRLEFFHEKGCRLSDHGLEPVVFAEGSDQESDAALKKALAGGKPSWEEIVKYKTNVMTFLGEQYARLGWTMQLHIGAMRGINSKASKLLGPDAGFDAMGDSGIAAPLAMLLDGINSASGLPKTILYCINPCDNEVLASVAGSFQDASTPGKMQFGSGWWFNDQKEGMLKQMTALANIGLLGRFVGMLTDSRSFLSYTRHEYFRRLLCDLIGEWVEKGEAPDDMTVLGEMVRNISYGNAERYFGFTGVI